jgi:hypothetical protein
MEKPGVAGDELARFRTVADKTFNNDKHHFYNDYEDWDMYGN